MLTSSSNPEDRETLTPDERRGPAQNGTAHQPSHLTRRQILALPILAAAPNMTQAAREAGISESTLYRWLKDEHFRDELRRMTAEAAERTRQELEGLTLQSIKVLRELMEDPDPMVRLRAARAIAAISRVRTSIKRYFSSAKHSRLLDKLGLRRASLHRRMSTLSYLLTLGGS